ncbi:uncharacterized protein BCR38DRAFT_527189 [Pseudomassariella vexata]|uniref:Uncharacterized protein n=1 Tax=Pseudomassariella vexata TaxID=1141098 RepID=A0A1Y2DJ43_9PEZI|nr:uncharacterized protein BCR38DRAFT_527189 [Pseudomassariella vexata]ORY59230.1 hypothetical protein BCR38DRAFT_527189 [Pseudomassariella vexata]
MASTVAASATTPSVPTTPFNFPEDCLTSQSIWDISGYCSTTWGDGLSSTTWQCSSINYGPPEPPASCLPHPEDIYGCPSGYTSAGSEPYGTYDYFGSEINEYTFWSQGVYITADGVVLVTDSWCSAYSPTKLNHIVTDAYHVDLKGITTLVTSTTLLDGVMSMQARPITYVYGTYKSGGEGVSCVPSECPLVSPTVTKTNLSIITATTTFTPAPTCLEPINIWEIHTMVTVLYYDDKGGSLPSSLAVSWTQLGPRSPDPDCYPASTKSNEGACPAGYTYAGKREMRYAFNTTSTTWRATPTSTVNVDEVVDEICCPTAHNFTMDYFMTLDVEFGTFVGNEGQYAARWPFCATTSYVEGKATGFDIVVSSDGTTEARSGAAVGPTVVIYAPYATFRHYTTDIGGWTTWIADDAPFFDSSTTTAFFDSSATTTFFDSSATTTSSTSNSETTNAVATVLTGGTSMNAPSFTSVSKFITTAMFCYIVLFQ